VTIFFSSAGGPYHKLKYILWATNLHRRKAVSYRPVFNPCIITAPTASLQEVTDK